MGDGHTSEVIDHYEVLLAREPNSRAFAQLADAYRQQGRSADAIAVCARGLERYPTYVGARLILARALAEHGDVARAEAEFRRVLEQTPDHIPAHRALGELLRLQGRPAEALAVYESLRDLVPFDQEVVELLASLRAAPAPAVAPRAAESREAEPAAPLFDLTEVAAEPPLPLGPPGGLPEAAPVPAPALATETLAELYVQQGFVEEARAIYRELVRVQPSREDLRAKLASLAAPAPAPPAEEDVLEPWVVAVSAPAAGSRGGDDLAEVLQAWLVAARGLRAERRGR